MYDVVISLCMTFKVQQWIPMQIYLKFSTADTQYIMYKKIMFCIYGSLMIRINIAYEECLCVEMYDLFYHQL